MTKRLSRLELHEMVCKRPPNTLPTRGARTALTARGSASPQAISYWGDAGCQSAIEDLDFLPDMGRMNP